MRVLQLPVLILLLAGPLSPVVAKTTVGVLELLQNQALSSFTILLLRRDMRMRSTKSSAQRMVREKTNT